MNKVSDNLSAESLLKILGAERSGTRGTAAAGVSVVKEFLANEQIDTTGIVIADGSGVSRYNLTSAGTIVALLRAMYRSTGHFGAFVNSLPAPGEFGSLSDRMRGFGVEASVRAKTGTLAGACALSGYVYTRDGEPIAFSILMQNYPRGTRTYRAVQDQIVNVLSRMTRSTL
jgi:D-alanyl-D-alanine carboxypeptidase/D-alanyl-D-alanine-endopeptidase (penicillin-binding protein 4)